MDDFNFEEPIWSLYQTIHWIAFGQSNAPSTERSAAKFELAGVELLRKCQNGDITLQGIKNGRGESKKIPREFNIEAEFEPLSNAIYVKDQWQPEAPWQIVNLYRDDVLARSIHPDGHVAAHLE